MKIGCKFYVAFTKSSSESGQYRCSGINPQHQCTPDPMTWDRYAQHRTKDPIIRHQGIAMLDHGITAGPTASFLNSQYSSRVRRKDLNRMLQTNRQKTQSLNDQGLDLSESRRLLQTITMMGDQYRVKYRGNTQIMECIFYWDPTEVTLARRFSQVKSHYIKLILGPSV